jgi:hypothetical protein
MHLRVSVEEARNRTLLPEFEPDIVLTEPQPRGTARLRRG